MAVEKSSTPYTFLDTIKKEVIDLILGVFNSDLPPKQLQDAITVQSPQADIAFPCFVLAKELRKKPDEVAEILARKIKVEGVFKEVKNEGSYLNFYYNYEVLAENTIEEALGKADLFEDQQVGENKKVMIEYSSPNTHKEFHVGHLRNVSLGGALVNLYRVFGYTVIPVNYINDSGAHVARVLWYLDKFKPPTPSSTPSAVGSPPSVDTSVVADRRAGGDKMVSKGAFLGEVYAKASQEIEKKEEYEAEVKLIHKKLLEKDEYWMRLWKETRGWSMDLFHDIYKLLGLEFEVEYFSSEEDESGKKVVEDLLNEGIAQESEGAIIIDLSKYDLDIFLILKSDGMPLYATQDLSLAQKKFKERDIDISIVLTDSRQSFYFKQLFKTYELMGFKTKNIHVSYEFVRLEGKTMASRKGNVLTFQELYDIGLTKIEKETRKRHNDWSDKKLKEVSSAIVLAALKFSMLKSGNNKVVNFNLDKALAISGFTGPYLQYTNARINSIFKKTKAVAKKPKADYTKLKTNQEHALLRDILNYPEALVTCLNETDLLALTHYMFKLAEDTNAFYHEVPVTQASDPVRDTRLVLLRAVQSVLEHGMGVLGITPLKEM